VGEGSSLAAVQKFTPMILMSTEKDLVQLLSVDDLVARFACVADHRLDLD